MVASTLKLVSVVCCGFVVVSFGLFAYDQTSASSKSQVASVVTGRYAIHGNPTPKHPGQPRQLIDGVAHALTSPFRSIVHGDSAWAVWIVSTALALLVYGVGLGFAARLVRMGSLRA